MGARLLLQSYLYPNLSEGADRVGGQLRGDNEYGVYSFSGVTKSGRVWRKVPESDARSVVCAVTISSSGGGWGPVGVPIISSDCSERLLFTSVGDDDVVAVVEFPR